MRRLFGYESLSASLPINIYIHIFQPRMGMPPPGQPIGQQTVQPTIVLGRPGQPGSSAVQVNAAGGQIVRQQFVQPGGIRVQGKELKKKF